jgi:signal peptidase I
VLVVFAAVLAAGVFLRMFVIGAARIAGSSMEQTLLPGDFVLISKLTRTLPGSPSVGDVVAVTLDNITDPENPSARRAVVVKRCVAGPGDSIIVRRSSVWVNGEELRFPPTSRWSTREDYQEDAVTDVGPLFVPQAGALLSLTTRNFHEWKSLIESEGHTVQIADDGTISVDSVVTPQYRVARDYCFLLGDNPRESIDSRTWGIIPTAALEGRVMLVYWSIDAHPGRSSAIRWGRIGGFVR